jgi:hypothetical protein
MIDTLDMKKKLMAIWKRVDTKSITPQEARIHIGIARVVLDCLRVEICAARIGNGNVIKTVNLGTSPGRSTGKNAH